MNMLQLTLCMRKEHRMRKQKASKVNSPRTTRKPYSVVNFSMNELSLLDDKGKTTDKTAQSEKKIKWKDS